MTLSACCYPVHADNCAVATPMMPTSHYRYNASDGQLVETGASLADLDGKLLHNGVRGTFLLF